MSRMYNVVIKQNPDIEHVKEVRNKLRDNEGYCPCSLIKNHDTQCMCKDFREQETSGMCHCGLYIKEIESVD